MSKHIIRLLCADIPTGRGIQVGVFLFILFLFGILFTFKGVSPEIPLQYSRPWGVDQLSPKFSLLVLGAAGAVLAIVHVSFATYLFESDRLSSRIIIWSGILLLFLLIVSLATVYSRVGPQT